MQNETIFTQQVALLVRVIPYVATERCFALKGGTAINLFVHNLPRLSVDIDLAYLPLEPRDIALINIRRSLSNISTLLNQQGMQTRLQTNQPNEMRLIVFQNRIQIKIEVSPVARGTLYDPIYLDLVPEVEEQFGFASMQVVSIPDLYGGKLCAAMDRQHPRDFFDVKILLENQMIDRSILIGFITYLLSHPRPISEVMNPNWKDINKIYTDEFKGMSLVPVTLEELKTVPNSMLKALRAEFTKKDADFLKSFKEGDPDWSIAPDSRIELLPAVKWKLQNIRAIPTKKHKLALEKLKAVLSDWLD